ncbi:MAG: HYR domain-containing protein [Saprospiraceae bacterium]|nr:HYR domain-containing protein [Saprospiraceae bacterium]
MVSLICFVFILGFKVDAQFTCGTPPNIFFINATDTAQCFIATTARLGEDCCGGNNRCVRFNITFSQPLCFSLTHTGGTHDVWQDDCTMPVADLNKIVPTLPGTMSLLVCKSGNDAQTYTICSKFCCTLDVDCPPDENFQCAEDVPAPALDTAAFRALGGGVNDFCDSVKISFTESRNMGTACIGDTLQIIRVYKIKDSKDSISCAVTYNVVDTTRPIITCPIDVTVNCDANNQPPATGVATATDNCTNVVTNISSSDNRTNGSCNDNYLITRTWTAVDSCGNTNSCNQLVTVQDTTRPIITCPVNVTVNCDANNQPPATGVATATDNCTNVVTNISSSDNRTNGSCNDNYLITRTWTAVDSCGNSNSCNQLVTVQDTTRPIITCPIDVTVNCDANNQPPTTGVATATDNCTNVVTNISSSDNRTNGSCNDNYLITRTWTAVDSCGNSNSCNQLVTVQDTTRPIITCPINVTVNCDANNQPPATGVATATDNCTNVVTNISSSDNRTNGSCNDNYLITRTWTAVDSCGNSNSCNQLVTVQDTTRPIITCPINVTVNCDANNQPPATGVATATDNCTNVVTNISSSDNRTNGSCNDNYLITRTWTAVDSCGNTNSCNQLVTVQDTTRPIITCPIDVTVNCDANNQPPATGVATATDNCTNVVTNISSSDNRTNGSCNDNYLITRTWTAVDSCGNTNSCNQLVTVQDTTRPIITCPINVTVNCDANNQPPATGVATATDNCTNVVTNISSSDNRTNGSCNDNYLITRTWTAVDSCGNSNSCNQLVTVQDTTRPIITCPINVTVNCDANNQPPATGVATATDNCTNVVTNISSSDNRTNGSCNDNYLITRTWTAVDSCGNTNSCNQLVTVQDTTRPIITCPVNVTVNCDANNQPPATGVATATDNCTNVVTNISSSDNRTNGSCNDNYLITRTWTAVDSCGNSNSCNQLVTVQDTTRPIITCPINATVNCDANNQPPATGVATATDNCTNVVTNISSSDNRTNGSCNDNYLITRTWTAVDSCGNTNSCNQLVTVQDTTRPIITCPINVTVNCDANNQPPATGVATATDNCTNVVTNISSSDNRTNGSCNDNYLITRTWTAVDSCGNSNSCNQLVTVQDTTRPIITCPIDVTVNCDANNQPPATGVATATDNCTNVVTNISSSDNRTNGSCNDNYLITRTWTAVDSCGNTNSCNQLVTVQDTTRPIITCPINVTVNCDANNQPPATGVATATDNCTNVVTNISSSDNRTNGSCNDNYLITRTWTAVDSCGNSNSCNQLVTVQDTTRPIITCPINVTVNCDANNQPPATGVATATDNCTNVVTNISSSDNRTNGSCNDNYLITRTWTAVDSCGNTNSCNQLVTVQDTTRPIITCPIDVTVNCDANNQPPATGVATATDNCTNVVTNISSSDNRTNGSCNDNYLITRTWTAVDSCGNTNSCNQLVTVQDTTRPIITCPINVTVNCDANNQPPATGVATATDNCTNVVTNISSSDNRTNGSCNDNYLITRTWTAVDSCGNSNSCNQLVTVQDTTRPIITCPINVTVNCDANNQPPATGVATATDNCTNVVTNISSSDNRTNGSCNDNYLITRTWTAVDSCGNTNSCNQLVTVQDTTRPIITCPVNVTVNCDANNQPPATGVATATDNCTNVVTNISSSDNRTNGSCNDNYLITRTWTAVDSCGNSNSCNQMVTVQDTTRPIITCPINVTVNCEPGLQSSATASDNCTNVVTNITFSDDQVNRLCDHTYDLIRTWTAQDSCGNENSCIQIISVQDTTNPIVLCPSSPQIRPVESGECSYYILGTELDATGSDNCTDAMDLAFFNSFNGSNTLDGQLFLKGTHLIEWTVYDNCENANTCSFVLSIVDEEKPEIACPQNIVIPSNQQTCTATVSYPDPTLFDNCPCTSIKTIPGYILMDTFGGHAYYYSIIPTSFVNAAANAISAGGHLLTITSPAEDFFIAANSYFERWIGLSDQATEGTMQWINGEPFVYNNFCPAPGFQNDPAQDFVFVGQLSCSPDQWAFSQDNVLRQSILEFDYVPLDTCRIELLSGLSSGSEFPYGINNVQWIGYDASGNTDTCTFSVTVSDGGAPAITCPLAISINCDISPTPVNTGNPIVLDNCDPNPSVIFRDVLDNGQCPHTYSFTRTWVTFDAAGLRDSCDQFIVVQDTTRPTISCPTNRTINCEDLAQINASGTATATDNCTSIVTNITFNDLLNAGSCLDNFTINRTWTAVDSCGNSISCVQFLNVQDTTRPQLSCPPNMTVNCDANNQPPATGVATATDNCTNVVTNISSSDNRTNGSCNDNYLITRTWTAVDSCGNSNSCNQLVTVQDTTRPIITCPIDVTVNCDISNQPPATGVATATDNCTNVVTNISSSDNRTNGSCNDNYLITRTWIAVDSCGNSNSCNQLVTVQDTTRPIITCPIDVTVNCDTNNQPPATGVATATDNCTNVVTNISSSDNRTNGSCNDNYLITRTWTAVDSCGNTNFCNQLVTVQDTTRPIITCPIDVTVNCDANNQPPATGVATATDNCTNVVLNISFSDSKLNGACNDRSLISRTWFATDSCGNSSSCLQTILVQDTTRPVINCPIDLTFDCDVFNQAPNTGVATATDNCTNVITNIVVTDNRIDGTCSNNFQIEKTWIATDSCGNTNRCIQTITVQDTTRPEANCLDIDIEFDQDSVVVLDPYQISDDSRDNCDIEPVLDLDMDTIRCNLGMTSVNVTLTVTDSCGNSSTCISVVSIIDRVEPVMNCIGDYDLVLDGCECFGNLLRDHPLNFYLNATDNCDTSLTFVQLAPAGIPVDSIPVGTHIFTFVAIDDFGNDDTCSFTVHVLGAITGDIACKANVNVSLDQNCEALITAHAVLADKNCEERFYDVELFTKYGIPLPNDIVTSNYVNTELIVKVTSICNFNSCWSTIKVEDKFPPILICYSDSVYCGLNAIDPLPKVIENCGPYSLNLIDEIHEVISCDVNVIGLVRKTYQAIDASGNVSDTCTMEIYTKRLPLDSIIFPVSLRIPCSNKLFLDKNDNPDPLITGTPFFNSIDLYYPKNFICNLFTTYEDLDLGEINCVRKIMRVWTVREWWCNTEIVRTGMQVIELFDDQGPEITHMPYGFEATTGRRDCEARVLLPSIEAVDACHNNLRIDIIYPGGVLENQNGGYVNLPVGEDTVYYRVYDGCYNLTETYIIVHVRDETEPVAVCDRNTVVALNHSGYNWVPAEVFDDGSFDECQLHHFEVRRMDDGACGARGADDWGPEVGFCCEDVGKTIMVGFKAIDHSGNEAICMVSVDVQDKDIPLISCPPNITVDCRFDIDRNHLEVFGKVVTEQSLREKIVIDPNYWHNIGGHPLDGLAEDNCPPEIIEEQDYGGLNQCGLGYFYRYFTAVDQQGNRSPSCYQLITVINHESFDVNDIDFPDDLDTFGICNPDELIPERLAYPYGKPVVNDDECSLVGYAYHDHVLSATVPGDPCFKIIRVWKVIDWCQRDIDNNVIIWQDTQYIKVRNLIDPTIDRITKDTVICSYDVNCRPIPVTFSIEAGDDCTDPLLMLYTYKIDFDSDGTIDVVRAGIGERVASGTWPLGRHTVKWEVEDRCGNTAKESFVMDLRNCKPPVAYCLNGVSTNLTPMDLDGDGIPDTAMDSVWAKDFDAGSYHNCGYYVALSFSADTNDKYRVYDCDDRGLQAVELWVTDINGNTSFCRTFIDVQDNLGFCPPNIRNSNVEGIIATEKDDRVQNVSINLVNSGLNEVKTDIEGRYAFMQVPNGQQLELKPSKTDGWLNGVSTADIVKIQRHILGLEPLSTAYKMIAADVNRSGSITAKDISELRRLILGITDGIEGNTSWRFVHRLYAFNDINNCLSENFPESYWMKPLQSDMQLDFYAVKTGDVTNNAVTKGFNLSKDRNRKVLELSIEDRMLKQEQSEFIDLIINNGSEFEAVQFTLEWDPQQLEVEGIEGNAKLKISDENYSLAHLADGKLSFSWNGAFPDSDWLLKLKVKAIKAVRLSEGLHVSSTVTPALSVLKTTQEEGEVSLNFNGMMLHEFVVLPNEPNPWNTKTTIGLWMPDEGVVSFSVYDLYGKLYLKKELQFGKGYQEIQLDQSGLDQKGVYYYQLDYLNQSITRKMILSE